MNVKSFSQATLDVNFVIDLASKDKIDFYLPNISGKYGLSFKLLGTTHFERGHNTERFQIEIENLRKQFSEDHKQRIFSRYYKLRGTPYFLKVLKNDNDTDTRNFLLKRLVVLYLIFVQEFEAEKVREILMDRSSDSENYKITYFDHSLKIHFPKTYDLKEFVQMVKIYLSNPFHDLSTKDLKIVRNLTDTFSKLEIKMIQEFSATIV
jgi:hypothetical protein